jgi:hypothetical protein
VRKKRACRKEKRRKRKEKKKRRGKKKGKKEHFPNFEIFGKKNKR